MRLLNLIVLSILIIIFKNYNDDLCPKIKSKVNFQWRFALVGIFLFFYKSCNDILLLELLLLSEIVLEDEKHFEISLNLLVLLLAFKVSSIVIYKNTINYFIIIISLSIFLGLTIFTKENFGLGDSILALILSLSFNNLHVFIKYFFIMFFIPSIILTILLSMKMVGKNERIAFVKYVAISYFIIQTRGV